VANEAPSLFFERREELRILSRLSTLSEQKRLGISFTPGAPTMKRTAYPRGPWIWARANDNAMVTA
jgi:hypothetical protein